MRVRRRRLDRRTPKAQALDDSDASNKDDKAMIDQAVIDAFGSFATMNKKVRDFVVRIS